MNVPDGWRAATLGELADRAAQYVSVALPGLDPTPRDIVHCWVTTLPWGDDGVAIFSTENRIVRDLDNGALGIAVDQQVGLGIREHRAAHLLGPVVEMGDTAQRRLDAPEHDRNVLERLAAALGIDEGAAVRPLAAFAAGRVGVVVAQPAVRRVAVHHRVEVAAGDAEEQRRPAQGLERLRRLPVRLRDDADPEPLGLQQPADDGHAEARMVDIGVARHQHDIAGVPAERRHFGSAHRQKRRVRRRFGGLCPVGGPGHQGLFGRDERIHSHGIRLRTRKFNQPWRCQGRQNGRCSRGGGVPPPEYRNNAA